MTEKESAMTSSRPDLGSAFNRADFDGYIFDCDGTLADSMPIHYRAWCEALGARLGRPATEFTEELFYHCGGMPPRRIVEKLDAELGWQLPAEATAREKEQRFVALLPGVKPIPEVIAVLQSLGKSARVVVASGGQTGIVRDHAAACRHRGGPGPDRKAGDRLRPNRARQAVSGPLPPCRRGARCTAGPLPRF